MTDLWVLFSILTLLTGSFNSSPTATLAVIPPLSEEYGGMVPPSLFSLRYELVGLSASGLSISTFDSTLKFSAAATRFIRPPNEKSATDAGKRRQQRQRQQQHETTTDNGKQGLPHSHRICRKRRGQTNVRLRRSAYLLEMQQKGC